MDACDVGLELLKLRRELVWEGLTLGDYFHASHDKQAVRDRVFALLSQHDFRIYAQVLEKSKAQPQIRETEQRFYQHAWFYLFRHAMPKIVRPLDELLVTTAAIGTNKGKKIFAGCVEDVLAQTVKLDKDDWRASFCSAGSDPCLQVADYCTWAIQRKWEKGDDRSYKIIESRIAYEFDLWGHGSKHYY